MIIIPAKIKCDDYDCDKVVDVEIEYIIPSRSDDPSVLQVKKMPEGWTYNGTYGWLDYKEKHYCPEHKK